VDLVPESFQRVARLIHADDCEECVLAVVILPNSQFGALISYAKIDANRGRVHTGPDGRSFLVAPITDGPTKHKTVSIRCVSLPDAIARLETEKAKLLAVGWFESALDPINDPD
jgi:hypothetical protein